MTDSRDPGKYAHAEWDPPHQGMSSRNTWARCGVRCASRGPVKAAVSQDTQFAQCPRLGQPFPVVAIASTPPPSQKLGGRRRTLGSNARFCVVSYKVFN